MSCRPFPAGCNSSIANTVPSPQAISNVFFVRSMIVPGSAVVVCSSGVTCQSFQRLPFCVVKAIGHGRMPRTWASICTAVFCQSMASCSRLIFGERWQDRLQLSRQDFRHSFQQQVFCLIGSTYQTSSPSSWAVIGKRAWAKIPPASIFDHFHDGYTRFLLPFHDGIMHRSPASRDAWTLIAPCFGTSSKALGKNWPKVAVISRSGAKAWICSISGDPLIFWL